MHQSSLSSERIFYFHLSFEVIVKIRSDGLHTEYFMVGESRDFTGS